MRAYNDKKCFRVIIVIPLLPGFQVQILDHISYTHAIMLPSTHISAYTDLTVSQGGLDDAGAASVRAILHWQYRTICRGSNSILHNLYDILGPKTHDYISFYGLRAYGHLFQGGPIATSQVLPYIRLPYSESYALDVIR